MMLGQPESEHRRFRVGLMFLVLGVILLLWAWGSWLYRASVPPEPNPPARQTSLSILPIPIAPVAASLLLTALAPAGMQSNPSEPPIRAPGASPGMPHLRYRPEPQAQLVRRGGACAIPRTDSEPPTPVLDARCQGSVGADLRSSAMPVFLATALSPQPNSEDARRGIAGTSFVMMVVLLVMIVFLLGSYAAVILTRRYRAEADRHRAPPTANEDVWAMHKLPDEE